MAKTNKKGGLGRGLDALLGESSNEIESVKADNKSIEETPEITTPSAEIENSQDRLSESYETDASSPDTSELQDDDKPAVYIEEDDHVEIHGVVERAARATDEVPLAQIVPNPDQPRTHFKPEEIEELAASIEKEGLLQPIVVRAFGDQYQIIAGERRWQACRALGLRNVAVRIINASDDKAIELALVENVQRSDLNPIEEAYGYKRLMERQGLTQAEVASAVSKGRSTIANALRLLELPEEAQQLLFEEKISAGHARAILSVPTEEGRRKLTERLKAEHLSVRDTENLARLISGLGGAKRDTGPREPIPSSFKKVAQALRERLEAPVRVKSARGKNKIEIEFKDEEELKRLFKLILNE